MRSLVSILAAFVLAACSSGGGTTGTTDTGSDAGATPDVIATPDTTPELPAPQLWAANDLPDLVGPFHEAHPELLPWSRWRGYLDHTAGELPDYGGRGAFGVGNGRVFGIIGLADPANTLHNLAGPDYEQGENFYGDLSVLLEGPDAEDGESWDEEWVLTSFGAPALLWRGRRGALEMDVVDLTPWPIDGAGEVPPIQRSYLRTVLVRNTGDAAIDGLTLVVDSYRGWPVEGEARLEESRDGRAMTTFLDQEGVEGEGHTLRWTLPTLAAGDEQRVQIYHLTYAEGADVAAEREAVLKADIDALFAASGEAMTAWWAEGTTIESPDPMVDDLLKALTLMLKVQITAGGATTAMSNYAGTWTRDNVGPVFGMLAMGFHDDAAGMLDYYYRAVLDAGGLKNRYTCALDPSEAMPAAPDWDALGEGSGRTQAEAPSYVPMMYDRYVNWTGDLTRATDRLAFLHYTIRSLVVNDEGLLSWSGDETFRTAMNAALGIPLEYAHHELNWSTNSSFLFAAGARAVARFARLSGDDELADEMEARADFVFQGALDHLRLEDGCWAAYAVIETGELSPGTFEDVALKELWAGTISDDDPDAAERLACLIERTGLEPGVLQSPLHEVHAATPILPGIEEGVYTGMLPGYTLDAYARAGHEDGEAAFNAMAVSADSSGNYTEYQVFDTRGPLQFMYNPEGSGRTDYTARFRPWEGGINLHALAGYVVGLRPDALGPDHLVLRPHMPNEWPTFTATGLRVADGRFDLTITRTGAAAYALSLTSHAARDFTLDLVWDHASDETWTVSGAEGELVHDDGAFLSRVTLPGVSVPAGGELSLSIVRE